MGSKCSGCEIDNMWPPFLRVTYIDGEVYEGTVEDFENIRGEGVSHIDIRRRQFAGDSVYWLYTEEICPGEEVWVSGSFSLHSRDAQEILFRKNGEDLSRKRRDLPDLRLTQVKLGWWYVDD